MSSFQSESSEQNTTFSPEEQNHLTEVIKKILTEYDRQPNNQSVEEFTTQFVEQQDTSQKVDKKQLLGDILKGFSTLDKINECHQDLTNAQKSEGKSRLSWLRSKIQSATDSQDVEKISKIIQEAQSTLAQSNNQYLASLLNEEGESVEVFTSMPERDFEGNNQGSMIGGLLGEVQRNSLLTIVSTAQTFQAFTDNFSFDGNPSQVAQNCFEGELGNEDELLVKKLLTAGVMIANATFQSEALNAINGLKIAMIVDIGITIAKVGYKVSQGEMNQQDAFDYIYDRMIAIIAVVISTMLRLGIEEIGMVIGSTLGGLITTPLGMPMLGATYGGFIGRLGGKLAGNQITPKIEEGVKKIGTNAKPRVKDMIEQTGKVGVEIKEKVEEVFS